jgi:nitrite reductase/ring-hydroxylating ferredoxin subunit
LSDSPGWFALAGSVDLPAGTMLAVSLSGRRLALWRDDAGRPRLWDDHCPHRGTQLTIGRIAGGTVMCRYHGWRFDADGHCVSVPALPGWAPPATMSVTTFGVAERNGLIWGSLHTSTSAEPDRGPYEDFGNPGSPALFCRSFVTRAGASDLMSAFLHFPFMPFGGGREGGAARGQAAASGAFIGCWRSGEGDQEQVLAMCVQPVDRTKCVAHLLAFVPDAARPVAVFPRDVRRHFNLQFSTLRRRLENAMPAATAAQRGRAS